MGRELTVGEHNFDNFQVQERRNQLVPISTLSSPAAEAFNDLCYEWGQTPRESSLEPSVTSKAETEGDQKLAPAHKATGWDWPAGQTNLEIDKIHEVRYQSAPFSPSRPLNERPINGMLNEVEALHTRADPLEDAAADSVCVMRTN